MEEEITNKPKQSFTDYIKNNKIKILMIISSIVLAIIIIIAIGEYKKKQNIKISKKYNQALILIEKKNSKEAFKILESIISTNNIFYSPSALNLIVDNNLTEDKKKILSYYDQIISNNKLESETKNLFIFKKIIFMGDNIEENELLNNLKPIINSDSLWKTTISDYIKKYYLSRGEFNKAKEFQIPSN